MHVGRFSEKAAQDQVAKMVKTHGDSTSFKSPVPKPPTISSPRPPSVKKGAYGALVSNQQPADQPVDGKNEEADDKEVLVNPSNPDKKLWISSGLEAKLELTLITFLRGNLDIFALQISGMPGMPMEVI
jgi:myo-inositol-hexaphosphate 3-phosphohydrolase